MDQAKLNKGSKAAKRQYDHLHTCHEEGPATLWPARVVETANTIAGENKMRDFRDAEQVRISTRVFLDGC